MQRQKTAGWAPVLVRACLSVCVCLYVCTCLVTVTVRLWECSCYFSSYFSSHFLPFRFLSLLFSLQRSQLQHVARLTLFLPYHDFLPLCFPLWKIKRTDCTTFWKQNTKYIRKGQIIINVKKKMKREKRILLHHLQFSEATVGPRRCLLIGYFCSPIHVLKLKRLISKWQLCYCLYFQSRARQQFLLRVILYGHTREGEEIYFYLRISAHPLVHDIGETLRYFIFLFPSDSLSLWRLLCELLMSIVHRFAVIIIEGSVS